MRVVAQGSDVQVRWSGRDDRGDLRLDAGTPEILQPSIVLLAGGDYDLEVTGGDLQAQVLVYRPE